MSLVKVILDRIKGAIMTSSSAYLQQPLHGLLAPSLLTQHIGQLANSPQKDAKVCPRLLLYIVGLRQNV